VTRLDHGGHTRIVKFVDMRMVAMGNGMDSIRVFIIIARVVIVFVVIFFSRDSSNDFEFATENHGESVASYGFLYSRNSGTITPFIDLTAKSVRFVFEQAELTGREHSMATGGMDMSD
jgi:hypothetical protein